MIDIRLISCPVCQGRLRTATPGESGSLCCIGCGRTYPVRSGIPLLLRDPSLAGTVHQVELAERPGYSAWKERLILKGLTDAQLALDFGAGRQAFDDPCIVKLDVVWDPTLDVVGDLHELPFDSESFDFVFGGAVMEHVRDPNRAIDELYRVLRPGGYVYADWSFLTAYHGYPDHYFNVTVHGIQQAFGRFTCLDAGAAPHTGPSWALRSVLGTYLENFKPETRVDREFVELLHRVLWHPLDEMDERIDARDRFRVAAGIFFFGVKQPHGNDTILPPAVIDAYRRRPDLQARFPQPLDISVPDNLMSWARKDGIHEEPTIREYFTSIVPSSKDGSPVARRAVRDWPDELMTRADEDPGQAAEKKAAHWFSRPLGHRLLDSWEQQGVYGIVTCFGLSVRRFATHTLGRIVWFRRAVRAVKSVLRQVAGSAPKRAQPE